MERYNLNVGDKIKLVRYNEESWYKKTKSDFFDDNIYGVVVDLRDNITDQVGVHFYRNGVLIEHTEYGVNVNINSRRGVECEIYHPYNIEDIESNLNKLAEKYEVQDW